MKSNFNDYYYILQARKSKKFKELDDTVRAMTVDMGKGKGDKKQYEALLKKRDNELNAFIDSVAEQEIVYEFDKDFNPKIAKSLNSYCDKFPNTKLKNIIFIGATGTGKTHTAQILKDKLQSKGFSTCFTTTFNLVKRMNDNLYGQDPTAHTDLMESSVLIIDDLGTEPNIRNSDDFLYAVINERYNNNKAFIITTNLSNEQILNRYEQRLFGRIFDKNKTAVLTFTGKDMRIE